MTLAAALRMFDLHRFVGFPPVLLTMILVPVAGAVITLLLPRTRPEYGRVAGYVASMIVLGMSVFLLLNFDKQAHGFQFADSHAWINFLGVRLAFGVDGISLFMVVLT